LTSEAFSFATVKGEAAGRLVTARGIGRVDFALIPHLDNENHPDASLVNAEKWAAKIPTPVYAIDDQTAIAVTDREIQVVSEGHWRLFPS
jgi:dipeptidase E